MQRTNGRSGGNIAATVLDGPHVSSLRNGVYGLDGDAVCVDFDEISLEKECLSDVGFFRRAIGIEVNHVAQAEVGQEVFALIGHIERDNIIAVELLALCFSGNGEAGIDVSRLFFDGQRHVP